MTKILLLKYNKPINEAWDSLAVQCNNGRTISVDTVDMAIFGPRVDQLSFLEVSNLLDRHKGVDFVFVGDIFWPTGQNICRWGRENKVNTLFLQHGQWIYTVNKRNPQYTPDYTCVLGENILQESLKWPLAKTSKIVATGSPRYDFYTQCTREDFDYFAPPVMVEYVPGQSDRDNPIARQLLEKMSGLDTKCTLFIHPHYREKDILSLRQMFPKAVILNPHDSALNWINRCRYLITHRNSSSVLDAIACKKHSLLMNFGGFSSAYSRGYFGEFATEFDDMSALKQYVGSASVLRGKTNTNPKQHLVIGNATHRILDLIDPTDHLAGTCGGPGAEC